MTPKCIEIFKKGQSQGKLLMSLCLLKTINKNNKLVSDNFKTISEIQTRPFNFKISCLGLRDLPKDIHDPIIKFSIKSMAFEEKFNINENEESIKTERVNLIR
jgi:hypothetical protein